ncbi:MAG: PAS domain S-box protein [Chloroflexi bacterium]|nr:PAS domain S-box protein [Chloroflexota bacterium]
MIDTPSYEELGRRLNEMEKQNTSLIETIEKLRESEERLKTIFENADDHIAYIGLDDRIIDVNHKFEDIFGHNRDDVLGKKFYEFSVLSPEDWQRSLEYTRGAIGEDPGHSPVLEFEAVAKDGRKVYLEVNPRAVVKDGEIVGFLSITRDITERRRAEDALRESEEKFKTIFENANDHIVYIDVDGTVIDINQAFEDILGYKREEVIGKKFYEFEALNLGDWQKAIDAANDLLEGKSVEDQVFEFEAIASDGRTIYIEVNPKAVVKDGRIVGVLAITRDVTARKQERDDLEELVKERTSNLEEANTALRVMLKKAEEVKTEMEDRILFNVKEFVFPYLERLKRSPLSEIQMTHLENLEENLNDITSPFLHGISTRYMRLTPTEIQVANHIKQGKTTKETAQLLNMSPRTIETHRYNIRTKLGVKNEKVNLRTYLSSFV